MIWIYIEHLICFCFNHRCGDNIDYGYRFGRDFVDTPEKEINPNAINSPISFINTNQTGNERRRRKPLKRGRIRRQMNIHNNEVGRRVNFKKRKKIILFIYLF
jgi:hypothetical protein